MFSGKLGSQTPLKTEKRCISSLRGQIFQKKYTFSISFAQGSGLNHFWNDLGAYFMNSQKIPVFGIFGVIFDDFFSNLARQPPTSIGWLGYEKFPKSRKIAKISKFNPWTTPKHIGGVTAVKKK